CASINLVQYGITPEFSFRINFLYFLLQFWILYAEFLSYLPNSKNTFLLLIISPYSINSLFRTYLRCVRLTTITSADDISLIDKLSFPLFVSIAIISTQFSECFIIRQTVLLISRSNISRFFISVPGSNSKLVFGKVMQQLSRVSPT